VNPFRDAIVASPWTSAPTDLSEIHNTTFDACLRGLDDVRTGKRSSAVLIHGEAGSGKTHLLGRLRSRLAPQAPIATDRPESLFVWCRLQTSPRMLWRSLRRTIVEDWFRPLDHGRSQIDRILFHRLAAIRPAEWDLEPWYEYMLDEDPQGLSDLIEQIAQAMHLDHNLAVAFRHLAFGRFRRELRAWLSGTSLPDSVLDRMELSREDGTEEELEEHARQVVLMLCQLTGPDLPILLSFDQVEALQSRPGDAEGLFVFGQAVGVLHDQTKNVLLVSCMQSSFATELKTHVRGADYDRMVSGGQYSLQLLNRDQSRQLIAARLDAAGISSPSGESPSCWPLEEVEFESLLHVNAVTPRRLLNLCAERFDRPDEVTPMHDPQPAHPEERYAGFLQDQLDKDVEENLQTNTPDRTEELIQHGLPLVVDLLSPSTQIVHDQALPDVSLIFETRRGRLGLSICTQSNMTSLANRLRRLKSQLGLRKLQRLVLIRDDRVPLSKGAKAARKYLQELEEQQAVTVFPSLQALATLDALRNLLSNAKAGDLSTGGETIAPATVGEWLKTHLPRVLSELADEVLGGMSQPEVAGDPLALVREELSSLLYREPVLSIEEAAGQLGRATAEIIALARKYPDQFGVLGNPANTIFRRTAEHLAE